MLELDNVTKHYGDTVVLDNLSLTVERGKIVALIGPSGCGKSTLLRIIMGLIPADQGQVRIEGTKLTPQTVRKLRHRMGYVLQDGGLFPHLTARDNVTLLAKQLRAMPPARIDERTRELAELTRLPFELLDRFPSQLSGGQQQRVALMRALMLDPPILLLDEPLGALDPLVRYDLQEDLQGIFRTLGKTVVLVTHDLAEAAFFSQDVIMLHGGRIIQRGSIDQFLQRPANQFVQRFVVAQRFLPDSSST